MRRETLESVGLGQLFETTKRLASRNAPLGSGNVETSTSGSTSVSSEVNLRA